MAVLISNTPRFVCSFIIPAGLASRIFASTTLPGGNCASAGGGAATITVGATTGAGVGGGVEGGGTMALIIHFSNLSTIAPTSVAASVFGNLTRMDVWARIVSLTFMSLRITPAKGGENFKNPSHAFNMVL